ncbi:histidine kinase [Zunongwangia sp. F363]|uniref:Histidine kinase n=1 Tax=Autumnicola tepida TaxID=3075595 RepID=A0ABU3C9B7_9FLAO|nr:histidine kinase [Zunongwangia sp. F363]MDT0642923.1 histidine kinase [Zunongwangia sp. F363]
MASINNNVAQHYRITYEAYSKFANGINRCGTISEVIEDLRLHLKYLLNFHAIRMLLQQEDKFLFLSIFRNDISCRSVQQESVLRYEQQLLKDGVPIKTPVIPKEILRKDFPAENLQNPELWAWSFQKNERKVLVSLVADEQMPFAYGDVEILKMVTDCLEAKFQEIYLKNQLAEKNASLGDAYKTIKEQNGRIREIVENQKEIIEERTREIVQKNEKLLHISALNAHNVKEPLSRIQGIIQLLEVFDDKACREELFPKLVTSVEEMDVVLKEVIEMASQELVKLKAEKI